MQSLSGKAFLELYTTTPNSVMIDVRTEREFNGGHIHGAQNIDIGNPNAAALFTALPLDAHYFVYCLSGARSSAVAAFIEKRGCSVVNLAGGITRNSELATHTA